MNKSYTISFLFIYLFSICGSLYSQNHEHVDHIGSEDGLSSQLCQNIIEDDLGNIWISSFKEVQKYDGHHIEVFELKNENQKELNIHDLAKDGNGNIWVIENSKEKYINTNKSLLVTYDYNISIINPLTNNIIPLENYIDDPEFNNHSIIWIGIRNETIYIMNEDLQVFKYQDQLSKYYSISSLKDFIGIDHKGSVIQYDKASVLILNPLDKSTYQLPREEVDNCDAIIMSKDGHLFLSYYKNGNIIFKLNKDGSLIHRIEINEADSKLLPPKYVNIEKNLSDRMMIGNNFYINHEKSNIIAGSNKSILPTYDFLISKSNILYIATDLGVFIIKDNNEIFNHLAIDKDNMNSVRNLLMSKDLQCYKTSEKEIITSPSLKYDIDFNESFNYTVASYYRDPKYQHYLWSCGKVPSGTRLIDLKKGKINYNLLESSYTRNPKLFHRSSYSDSLYILGSKGLFIHDSSNNKFEPMKFSSDSIRELMSSSMNHVIEKEDKLWIASNRGVIVFDEQTNKVSIDTIFENTITDKIIFIHQDKKDNHVLWLGTARSGLKKWNTNNNTVITYDTSNGLSNNNIHAIIEDKHNRLWISTNRNLNCYDKNIDKNYIYTIDDGLSNSEFNRYSYYHDTLDNQVYFGGLNGYNYFNPDNISTTLQNNNIQVRIIKGSKIKADASIEDILKSTIETKTIKVYEDDVSIDLDLSTTHLHNSKKVQYNYRIPELYSNWKVNSTNNIKLNRQPYGEFTLEIVADLNRPAYTSDILNIRLEIIKPFSKTWTYYILCLTIFCALLWHMVNLYLKSVKERNKILEETVTTRTAELTESNNTKNKLFAILAHDLRNPIHSLTDISEKIKFLARNNRLEELGILAEQTKDKINALDDNLKNILLWAASENNMLSEEYEKHSLALEIKKIIDLYSNSIKKKNLKININLVDIDQVYLGLNVLQLILRNIISNAIKFSYPDGEINIYKKSESKDRLELVVEDSGIGLNQEKIESSNIKTRINQKGKGLGIGLQITKQLASQSNIIISLQENKSGGTTATIDMPKV